MVLADSFYYQPVQIDTINTRVNADLFAKEGDANGRGLLVTLTENGLMKDTTGITLILKWEHTSVGNQGLDNFEAVDPSKGLYKITYPTEMLNRGKVRAFIRIIDSGKLAGTRNIEITVDRGVGDDTAIASSDSFSALAQALIDVTNLESTYAPRLLSLESELADKVGGGVKAEPEDLSATTLGLVTGTGGPINLLSIPQDASVTPIKTTFMRESINLNKGVANDLDITTIGTYYPAAGRYASDLIDLNNLRIFSYKIRAIAFYDASQTFITYATGQEAMQEIPIPENAVRFRFSVSAADIGAAFICLSENEIVEPEYNPKIQSDCIDVNTILSSTSFVKSLTTGITSILNAGLILNIACYGDSLTEGAGSSNAGVYSYPVRLQSLIDAANASYQVANRGVGGEDTNRIMVRQGSFADYVNPFTIPADTNPVVITKSTSAGADISGNTTIKNDVNPVTIAGIEGTLAYTGGSFTFARSVAGAAVTLTHKTPLLRYSARNDKNKILIAFMGQNGGYTDTQDLINLYRRMIEFNGNNKFMIIGLPSGTTATRTDMETAMERAFGSNFINMREYLVNYGLLDNGLTATTQDNADIAVGTVPTQIRSDSVHMNNYGYFAIANAVYARGRALGYWL